METETTGSWRGDRAASYMDKYDHDSKRNLNYNTDAYDDEQNCCRTFSKRFLFVVNIILFVIGLGLVIIGVYILDNQDSVSYDGFGSLDLFCWFAIISGLCVALVGFCGCASVASKKRIFLIIFIVFLVFILLAEIALIIFALVLEDSLKSSLKEQWLDYSSEDRDKIEEELECCSFDNPCGDSSCGSDCEDDIGCYQSLKDDLTTYIEIVLGAAIGIALYDIVMIVVATCLCLKNKGGEEGEGEKEDR